MPNVRDPRAPTAGNVVTRHEQLIRELVDADPRICRNGFWEAMRLLAEELDEDTVPTRERFGFLPDAYMLDKEREEIVLYEVEVTHTLKPHKARRLADFWMWWESSGDHDWMPRLVLVNRYGHQSDLDMKSLYYSPDLAA